MMPSNLLNKGTMMLSAAAISLCTACSENTRNTVYAVVESPNGTFASTFMKDASKPMQNEWYYDDEVCDGVKVRNLPLETQREIYKKIWDKEMVRECTQPDIPKHDI